MPTISLSINQNTFDQILGGTKKQEKRELTPHNIKKFVLLDDEGYEVLDENENSIPIEYDTIRFTVGNAKNSDTMLVEIVEAHTEIFKDQDDKIIEYVIEKTFDGHDVWWVEQQIVYNLGKILEYQIKGGKTIKP